MNIQSMSTDKTRAPSFASSAANGRPTTSDLPRLVSSSRNEMRERDIPVDDGDDLSSSSITIVEHLVVHTQMFQHLDDCEWCAR
jgi:hypothetical protein